MSIAALEKLTLVSHAEDEEAMVRWIQGQGCAHPIAIDSSAIDRVAGAGGEDGIPPVSPEALEALRFLEQAPRRRRQVSRSRREVARFDPLEVQEKALALKSRLVAARERREDLVQRLGILEPWGQFEYRPLEEMGGRRLWFYEIPLRDLSEIGTDAPWEILRRTERHAYVVAVSPEEPTDMPAPRAHVGDRPLSALVEELEELDLAIEDLETERERLSRWTELLSRNLDSLHDHDARERARRLMARNGPVRAFQAWVPTLRAPEIEAAAGERGYLCLRERPGPDDDPPTLLVNRPAWQAGEPLVTFYTTPGYGGWDPSGVVLVSFALFFAMILADAGYALVLGGVLALLWRRLGRSGESRRWRRLGLALFGGSLVYGLAVGSYFGMAPPPGSWLGAAHFLDHTDPPTMMRLCLALGVAHIVLGCLMESRSRRGSPEALAPLGWAAAVLGGGLAAAGRFGGGEALFLAGCALGAAGLLCVAVFAGAKERSPWKRLGRGFVSLSSVTGAFGDVLSYLRLFALGLAGSSLATTFNEMASGIRQSVAGPGLLLALLVAVPGHALNFLLCVVGGVIHGLRLNVIEFFNWSLKTEGRLFNPLRLRATQPWKTP